MKQLLNKTSINNSISLFVIVVLIARIARMMTHNRMQTVKTSIKPSRRRQQAVLACHLLCSLLSKALSSNCDQVLLLNVEILCISLYFSSARSDIILGIMQRAIMLGTNKNHAENRRESCSWTNNEGGVGSVQSLQGI
jgi:hypothetical protein